MSTTQWQPFTQDTLQNQLNSLFKIQSPTTNTSVGAGQPISQPPAVDPNTGIPLPTQPRLSDTFQELKMSGLLPNSQPISGFDDSYYKNLSDQAANRLHKQYFTNTDSLSNELKHTMNQRGLIGSGIEAGNISDLYKSFGDKMAEGEQQIAAEKAKNDMDLAKFNAQQGVSAAQLGLSAAGDQQRAATDYTTRIFDSLTKTNQTKQDATNALLDRLNSAMNNTQGIDNDTRNYFKTIFGNIVGAQSGLPINDYKAGQSQTAAAAKAAQPTTQFGPPTSPGRIGQMQVGTDGRRYIWTAAGNWAPA